MNFEEPKEMISESLKDSFQLPQSEVEELEHIFLIVSLVLENGDMLMGNLVGIEFGENPKLDMKIATKFCFDFIGKNFLMKQKISNLILGHGGELIDIPGPFSLKVLKIIEMDYSRRACVLAVDLFKDCP